MIPARKALVIGIDAYPEDPLAFRVRDADEMSDLLTMSESFFSSRSCSHSRILFRSHVSRRSYVGLVATGPCVVCFSMAVFSSL